MIKKVLKNRNSLTRDGIILSQWLGDQNGTTVKQGGEDIAKIITELKKRRQKVLILSDLTQLGKASLSARIEGAKIIHSLDFDRCAIFGNYHLFKGMVEAVILASGCLFKIRYFVDEAQARRWLTQKGN